MRILRGLLKWLLRLTVLLIFGVAGYAAYAHWTWRDIPVAALEQKYGDSALRTAVVDGVSLRYRLEGSGPALVLIHSHYMDMTMWEAWLPLLTPHFSVLRYDLSGHGLTGPDPSGEYSVDRDVKLLESLLKLLQLDSVAVVGSSLGGNIAFTFAAQQPQRVPALVLINSGGLKRAGSRSGREIPGWADHLLPLVPPAALHRFLTWMATDDGAITDAIKTRFVDFWRREGNRPAELARLRQFETGEPDPLLAAITAPVLILWGEDNPQLPVALSAEFEKKLTAASRVQRKTYPGAGHLLPLERPAESAADTLAFLRAPTVPAEPETPAP